MAGTCTEKRRLRLDETLHHHQCLLLPGAGMNGEEVEGEGRNDGGQRRLGGVMLLRGLRSGRRVRVRIGKSWIDHKKIVHEPIKEQGPDPSTCLNITEGMDPSSSFASPHGAPAFVD
mmetsp:Transcript_64733/g.104756  ORF Transcript_64733/g.104756 Transcript_64733/m.104756 type:complete len:117 (-) Transcript_64733:714-1064(-)